ncbi:hypothetical protein M5F60_21480, partial [Salmonella enterica]|nr:hypothetical protein [Salmonella enterica]MCN0019498.1 hypothetical protein [Salmonella enterica]MCN0023993.1 hypothetical protein [Salmonella enterica]MCN0028692.1 hypothetical protein [Salmonella enterica]MCN0047077.1 hypothetical protein [Salmonella enterica]
WLQPCLLKIYSHMVTFWGNYEGISQRLTPFFWLKAEIIPENMIYHAYKIRKRESVKIRKT